jgi:hypothetical protein
MTDPPKAKRAPAKSALLKLRLRGAYHATAIFTNVFGGPFWFFEQRKARLRDRIDNETNDDR